ncbi:MAG: hypothetical protein M3007_02570 [Candidatus Eremiobacteraeota bacterium]|nr:hypothetical protein [Candidatus Eremiobacteraeota bacterium]
MAAPTLRPPAPLLPMLLQQARAEFLMLIRVPAFSIVMLVFPIMFFALFGLPFAGKMADGFSIGRYLFASFGAYAVMTVALFSFGIVVAVERGEKRTLLMRASPLKPVAYLGGKIIASLAFAALTLALLFVFANLTAHLGMTVVDLLRIESRLLLGVFPFITLGFCGRIPGRSEFCRRYLESHQFADGLCVRLVHAGQRAAALRSGHIALSSSLPLCSTGVGHFERCVGADMGGCGLVGRLHRALWRDRASCVSP